jgi:hypothetical protein
MAKINFTVSKRQSCSVASSEIRSVRWLVYHGQNILYGIKETVVFGGEFRKSLREAVEAVVVLLLLERVIESRVTELLVAVGNEKLFKLKMKAEECEWM